MIRSRSAQGSSSSAASNSRAWRRSITAISAIILLVTPQYLLITTQINEFAEKGKYGVACAYATILIAIVYASIVIMNLVTKYFGTSRKIKGDSENA